MEDQLLQILENSIGNKPLWAILIAFAGGVISSVSPCVLSVLPIMVGYIGGYSEDKTSKALNFSIVKTPRAIISEDFKHRGTCYYSNYCGSYGCSSGAKGSSREALIIPALQTNNLTIITNANVIKLNTNKDKKITSSTYLTKEGSKKEIKAKLFILAAQAVESSRLLLNSKDKNFPNGVANNSLNVGKNLLSSSGGIVTGTFDKNLMPYENLMKPGLFVNRAIKSDNLLSSSDPTGASKDTIS